MEKGAEGLRSCLIVDLRTLSVEAKKPDSLTGQLTGWISGPEHPVVRDACEKALQRLTSEAWLEHLADTEASLRPFLLACETKSPKLANFSLICLQKLEAQYNINKAGIPLVIRALEQVERINDEGVKLKTLQTALTLMQLPDLAQNEEGIAAVLGVCFRLLADTKNSDSVLSTAIATVRQAVALVFEHVGSSTDMYPFGSGDNSHIHTNGHHSKGQEGEDEIASSPVLARHGAANAALKLLDDLCMMATANEAMLKWLRAPSLPRVFVLDLLDFVLSNTAPVFRNVAAFEHALSVRVCGLLITMLQNLVDPRCEKSLQENEMRVVLRVVKTVIWHFHGQLRSKCGIFVEALLAGASPECSLWQQTNVMLILRQLTSTPHIVQFLFTTYDLKQETSLNAITQIVQTMAGIIDRFILSSKEQIVPEAVFVISQMYQQKTHAGKDWPGEGDMSGLSNEARAVCLCTLAIDGLTGFALALETLTYARSTEKGHISESGHLDHMTCAKLVEASWRIILPVISRLLASTRSDALILQLLKAYAAFTKAAGELEMLDARDAFLSSLCEFTTITIEPNSDAVPSHPSNTSGKAELVKRNSSNGLLGAESSHVLSSKNVQAYKALFNVAHSLDHHLGKAWFLILENLNNLDRILHTPRTVTQEASSSQNSTLASDLALLSTTANQLFQSTSGMSTKACTDVLWGLREVSTACLTGTIPQNPGMPRLYALGRMVEVLLCNLHRLHDLWPIILEHIVEVLGDPRAPFRSATLDCLGKAVGGALASVVSISSGDRLRPRTTDVEESPRNADAATKAGAAEHMLIAALVELYADAREIDVQLGLLRIALQALQRHGEQLSTGWEMILKLLEAVPQNEEAQTISMAFQSIQLVAADFMPHLPARLLKSSLDVTALYAFQQADMNVGLTAINVLWNAADLLAKRSVHSLSGKSSHLESTPPPDLLDSQQFEDLMRVLFQAIQKLSMDLRPEVRNSAVRTLFLVITSQGTRLSASAWEETIWQLAFPLIRSVHHMAATSSREEDQTEILGKVRGKNVAMVMHHSRNSQQKAWDETLVLALAGMGKLLRSHFLIIAVMPDFPLGWDELMMILESSMAGGRREVAVAAMALLVTVMQAHANSDCMQRSMWKRALRATGVGVEAAASPQCMVPLQARLELITTIGQLHAFLKGVADSSDLHDMFGWLESLVKNPFSQDDCSPPLPGTLPPIQKSALGVYPSLAPHEHDHLWPDYLGCLIRLLRPDQLQPMTEDLIEPGMQPTARDLKRWANSSLLMETVLAVLVELFREEVPWQQRAANLSMCLNGIAECMATRYSYFSEHLWRSAVSAFITVVTVGVPAVNIAYVNNEQPPDSQVWSALSKAFESFLLGHATLNEAEAEIPESTENEEKPGEGNSEDLVQRRTSLQGESSGQSNAQTSEDNLRDADLEASVLDALTDTVLTTCSWCPDQMQHDLVAIVEKGVARPISFNLPGSAVGARFPQLCLRKLYVICHRSGTQEGPDACMHQVAKKALPLLLQRARSMLEEHASEASSKPNKRWSEDGDASRLDTFQCMLEVLAALTVSPSVTNAAVPSSGPLQDLLALQRRSSEQRLDDQEQYHLLSLYQPLVACISSPVPQVRQLIQDVLENIGHCLQLPSGRTFVE